MSTWPNDASRCSPPAAPSANRKCSWSGSFGCPDCEVIVHNVREAGAERAQEYGVTRVPTVVVDGTIAACCQGGQISPEQLQAAGIGQRLAQ